MKIFERGIRKQVTLFLTERGYLVLWVPYISGVVHITSVGSAASSWQLGHHERSSTVQAVVESWHTWMINRYLSLHEVEMSGNNRCQQIEMNSYPDSPLFLSTGFLPRVSSKRMN